MNEPACGYRGLPGRAYPAGVIGHPALEVRCHNEVGVIGLIGVHPPPGDCAGIRVLDALPAPPASELAALAVFCDTDDRMTSVLDWFGEIRSVRPAFALTLVASPERYGATLATARHRVARVIRPSELIAGGLPRSALDELREVSVEGRVLDRLSDRFGDVVLEELTLFRCLVAHGVRGGTLSAAPRDLDISMATVQRRLAAAGLRPRDVLRATRVIAYEERRRQGSTAPIAVAACGWTSPEHLRRARRRDEAAANRRG